MNEFSALLNSTFSDIVKKYNKFQLSNHSKESIDEGHIILNEGINLLNQLKMHVKSLETILSDCQDYLENVEEDLSQKPREEDFVFHTINGMLSYVGRDFIVKDKKKNSNANSNANGTSSSQVEIKTSTERILINEIGYYMKLPIIYDIKKIPQMFYYYKGDNQYSTGIYCCLIPNVFIKVPFPEIVDSTKEYNKGHSIKCKYKTKLMCDDQRSKMAKYHDSQIRICNYAHSGEKIVKIGYPSRCPNIPNFGNPETLTNDIKIIDEDSIKNILLYGLNDMIIASVYLDYYKMNQESNKIIIYDKLNIA